MLPEEINYEELKAGQPVLHVQAWFRELHNRRIKARHGRHKLMEARYSQVA